MFVPFVILFIIPCNNVPKLFAKVFFKSVDRGLLKVADARESLLTWHREQHSFLFQQHVVADVIVAD